MTLRAENRRVWQGRGQSDRVFRMLGLRAMASFASDPRMLAFGFLLQDIGVAGFTSFVPGVDNGLRCDLRNRIAPVMSILPKTSRDKGCSNAKEREQSHHEQGCDAEQMFGILHAATRAISGPVISP